MSRVVEFFEDDQKGNRLSAMRLAGLALIFSAIALAWATFTLMWHTSASEGKTEPILLGSLVGELLIAGTTVLGLRNRSKGEKSRLLQPAPTVAVDVEVK